MTATRHRGTTNAGRHTQPRHQTTEVDTLCAAPDFRNLAAGLAQVGARRSWSRSVSGWKSPTCPGVHARVPHNHSAAAGSFPSILRHPEHTLRDTGWVRRQTVAVRRFRRPATAVTRIRLALMKRGRPPHGKAGPMPHIIRHIMLRACRGPRGTTLLCLERRTGRMVCLDTRQWRYHTGRCIIRRGNRPHLCTVRRSRRILPAMSTALLCPWCDPPDTKLFPNLLARRQAKARPRRQHWSNTCTATHKGQALICHPRCQ